jgi:hypothetical protein
MRREPEWPLTGVGASMYLPAIVLLMGVLPILSILAERFVFHGSGDLVFLVGRWFVFRAVGVRLAIAGIRQMTGPAFTAETIFRIHDQAALKIVQELGFGTFSIGLLGVLSVFETGWIVPAAITGGLFYGLAGIKHVLNGERNAYETIATISDLFIFAVLAAYLAAALSGAGA